MASMPEVRTTDEVIAAVRQTKERLAAAMKFDVRRILDNARQHQHEEGRRILSAPPRPGTAQRPEELGVPS